MDDDDGPALGHATHEQEEEVGRLVREVPD
jgi:hypothetical protein